MSILQNGLLQPVSVRRVGLRKYQLVAGERRLRACRLAKLEKIPAILADFNDSESAALGLLENLQRSQLDPFDTARGIKEVIRLWGCTQAEAARRLGLSQPALANKLRLLTLTPEQQDLCTANHLSERHARAVLRLPEGRRTAALEKIARDNLSVRQTDKLVESMLAAPKGPSPCRKTIPMVRDVRFFVNTLQHAVDLMTQKGIAATTSCDKKDGCLEYIVRIPVGNDGRVAPGASPAAAAPAAAAAPVPTTEAPAVAAAAETAPRRQRRGFCGTTPVTYFLCTYFLCKESRQRNSNYIVHRITFPARFKPRLPAQASAKRRQRNSNQNAWSGTMHFLYIKQNEMLAVGRGLDPAGESPDHRGPTCCLPLSCIPGESFFASFFAKKEEKTVSKPRECSTWNIPGALFMADPLFKPQKLCYNRSWTRSAVQNHPKQEETPWQKSSQSQTRRAAWAKPPPPSI